jgi:hypothetical protein
MSVEPSITDIKPGSRHGSDVPRSDPLQGSNNQQNRHGLLDRSAAQGNLYSRGFNPTGYPAGQAARQAFG